MKKLSTGLSIVFLLLTIVAPYLVYVQIITPEQNKLLMAAGTVGWFLTAPFWIGTKTM